jgi:hypothetical protein
MYKEVVMKFLFHNSTIKYGATGEPPHVARK